MTAPQMAVKTTGSSPISSDIRHDWRRGEIQELFDLPLMDLLLQAQSLHRQYFPANEVQISSLLSIKTGGCPEDCAYCPQSIHHNTGLNAAKLMQVEAVLVEARKARDAGATRFCMGGAWRSPKDRDMDAIVAMVEGVKELGMESCMTLGMLDDHQTERTPVQDRS